MTEIFYMEDDEAIAMTVREYLSKKGFSVSLFNTLTPAGWRFLAGKRK